MGERDRAGSWSEADRFEQGTVKVGELLGAETLHLGEDIPCIPFELGHIYTLAGIGIVVQPLECAAIHFDSPIIIIARDVQIGHRDLQDSLIQSADRAMLGAPGSFEFLVRLEVFALVEQADSFDRMWG